MTKKNKVPRELKKLLRKISQFKKENKKLRTESKVSRKQYEEAVQRIDILSVTVNDLEKDIQTDLKGGKKKKGKNRN